MRAVNRKNGAVLAERVERATSMRARLRGLLGRNSLPEGEALVIEPCSSIHTFFMRFAIDAAFVGKDGRVLRAIPDLRPWRATRVYPSAALVIELPAGTLQRTATAEGDALAFEA
jgi:uncharacterized membrane protein (UPF0127 family)